MLLALCLFAAAVHATDADKAPQVPFQEPNAQDEAFRKVMQMRVKEARARNDVNAVFSDRVEAVVAAALVDGEVPDKGTATIDGAAYPFYCIRFRSDDGKIFHQAILVTPAGTHFGAVGRTHLHALKRVVDKVLEPAENAPAATEENK